MRLALRAHLDEVSGEELNALVFTEDPRLDHPVVFGHAEAPHRQAHERGLGRLGREREA
jgi:hypothetical protein